MVHFKERHCSTIITIILLEYNVTLKCSPVFTLQWRHNEHYGVSNRQPHDCILNRLFKAQIKEIIKAPHHWQVTGEFPNKWPVTRKILPFDDVIIEFSLVGQRKQISRTPRYIRYILLNLSRIALPENENMKIIKLLYVSTDDFNYQKANCISI